MPGPQVCVGGCLRVVARGMAVGARFRGASGTPPPTVFPGKGGDGSLPLIRPCGATFPQGGRQGLLLAAAGGRGGVRAPRPTDGDMETLWGLREQSFPGRRTVGAGHARPGGWRGHPSMVRSVGRGLDPSAGGYPGDGCWRKVSRGVGDAAPYGLPGNGRQRKVAAGWGHPALRMGIWKRPRGLRGHPFPGRRTVGAGHARPGGWRGQALPFYHLTLPTSPPAYSRCCRRQNRWGRSVHRPHARFRRWIRSRRASGHRRSGPDGTGVCCRRNFSAAG